MLHHVAMERRTMASSRRFSASRIAREAHQDSLSFRHPHTQDGGRICSFIRKCGGLDINSPYCYLLLCTHFPDTCLIAEHGDEIVGFVSGYFPPFHPDVIFVWQIGVARTFRGQGIARSLLEQLFATTRSKGICFIEATVTPSNSASMGLFRSFARENEAAFRTRVLFTENHFTPVVHEDETLIRIGPLKPRA